MKDEGCQAGGRARSSRAAPSRRAEAAWPHVLSGVYRWKVRPSSGTAGVCGIGRECYNLVGSLRVEASRSMSVGGRAESMHVPFALADHICKSCVVEGDA